MDIFRFLLLLSKWWKKYCTVTSSFMHFGYPCNIMTNVQERKGLHCDDATLLLSAGSSDYPYECYSVCVCVWVCMCVHAHEHAHMHIDTMTYSMSRITINQDKQHQYTFWLHTSLSPQSSNAHLKDFNKLLNINHEDDELFFPEVINFTGNSLQGILFSSTPMPHYPRSTNF